MLYWGSQFGRIMKIATLNQIRLCYRHRRFPFFVFCTSYQSIQFLCKYLRWCWCRHWGWCCRWCWLYSRRWRWLLLCCTVVSLYILRLRVSWIIGMVFNISILLGIWGIVIPLWWNTATTFVDKGSLILFHSRAVWLWFIFFEEFIDSFFETFIW